MTTAEQMRAWDGHPLLTYGFRPFFLFAGLWGALAMALWVPMLVGWIGLPMAFDPVAWHAHEFLFGYLGAVAAGFLLTAVPNWTGRLPIVGWPLGGLAALWLLGRVAMAVSAGLTPLTVALIDLSCLVVLAAVIAREIVAGRNWRNLVVLAMLGAMIFGNAVFHWEAAQGMHAANGVGLRIGIATSIMMIVVIGGRIVPSFTRNWLAKQGKPAPALNAGRSEKASILFALAALIIWVSAPLSPLAGVVLVAMGGIQCLRLVRWSGLGTAGEPLVWILHVGYLFVPLGAVAVGLSILFPAQFDAVAAKHLWMAGAVGVMTLAVMTRAILGHTGQTLTATRGTSLIYLAVIAAVLLRWATGLVPDLSMTFYSLSAVLWIAAFAGFAALYGPALMRAKHPA